MKFHRGVKYPAGEERAIAGSHSQKPGPMVGLHRAGRCPSGRWRLLRPHMGALGSSLGGPQGSALRTALLGPA